MLKIKECPYCHNKDGYYQKLTYSGRGIYRYRFINEKGEQEDIENGDMYDCLLNKTSKYYYCLNCHKRLGLVEKVGRLE